MSLFDGLGDDWKITDNTATLSLPDGRLLTIWMGERVCEVACCDTDGAAFVVARDIAAMLGTVRAPQELIAVAEQMIGSVVRAADVRNELKEGSDDGAVARHGAVASKIRTVAGAAGASASERARPVLRRLLLALRPYLADARPVRRLSQEARQELAALQIKLYDLSAKDMGVGASTALGNMIGDLLSGEADAQRKVLGWS